MKFVIFTCLLAIAAARPDGYESDVIPILKDDRVHPTYDGSYSFDVETGDGIYRSESGSPLDIEGYPVGQQGNVAFTFPNGEEYSLSFVADENGYQPDSAWLPVAPAFPHEIPQFVIDQIEFARQSEDGEGAGAGYGY